MLVSIGINVGMWLERILIIWNTLGDTHLSSMRHTFIPSLTDWSLLFGPLGTFAFLFLVFARTFPVTSMYEVRDWRRRSGHGPGAGRPVPRCRGPRRRRAPRR